MKAGDYTRLVLLRGDLGRLVHLHARRGARLRHRPHRRRPAARRGGWCSPPGFRITGFDPQLAPLLEALRRYRPGQTSRCPRCSMRSRLTYIPASIGAVLNATAPMFGALLAALFLGRAFLRRQGRRLPGRHRRRRAGRETRGAHRDADVRLRRGGLPRRLPLATATNGVLMRRLCRGTSLRAALRWAVSWPRR